MVMNNAVKEQQLQKLPEVSIRVLSKERKGKVGGRGGQRDQILLSHSCMRHKEKKKNPPFPLKTIETGLVSYGSFH
jgi:hypothetical protein